MSTNLESRLHQAVSHMHEPLAGVLCLDFANTLEPRGGPPPIAVPPGVELRDELQDYDDLVAWSIHKHVLDAPTATALLATADRDPATAWSVLERAHLLRDTIYRAAWAIAHGGSPATVDLDALMTEYADATRHASLASSDAGLSWSWPSTPDLARPLWPIAQSAITLLMDGDWSRIKVCPGPGRPPLPCAWLFYDTTRNGSRRWCSMADCGNATKVRLQTARRRATRA